MKNTQITKRLTIMVTLAFMLIAQLAIAQNGSGLQNKTPEERAQVQTKMMTSKLGLDSTQLVQVQAINLKYAHKTDPVLKSDAGKLGKFKQLKALQTEKDKELKEIFTADQFKKYQELKAEMKEKLKEKRQ